MSSSSSSSDSEEEKIEKKILEEEKIEQKILDDIKEKSSEISVLKEKIAEKLKNSSTSELSSKSSDNENDDKKESFEKIIMPKEIETTKEHTKISEKLDTLTSPNTKLSSTSSSSNSSLDSHGGLKSEIKVQFGLFTQKSLKSMFLKLFSEWSRVKMF